MLIISGRIIALKRSSGLPTGKPPGLAGFVHALPWLFLLLGLFCTVLLLSGCAGAFDAITQANTPGSAYHNTYIANRHIVERSVAYHSNYGNSYCTQTCNTYTGSCQTVCEHY